MNRLTSREKGFYGVVPDLSQYTNHRRQVQESVLRRVVGIGALYSTGYGDVGSSIYYALGITTVYAQGASFLAILVAGLFFVATVLIYAELSSAIPEAGGSSLFAQRAFGDGWAFFAGWALLLDYILTLAISAFSVGPTCPTFFQSSRIIRRSMSPLRPF